MSGAAKAPYCIETCMLVKQKFQLAVPLTENLMDASLVVSTVAGTATEVAPAARLSTLPRSTSLASSKSTEVPAGMLPLPRVQLTDVTVAPGLQPLKGLLAVEERLLVVSSIMSCGQVETSTPCTSQSATPRPPPEVAAHALPEKHTSGLVALFPAGFVKFTVQVPAENG